MDRTYFNDCQHGSNAVADAAIDRCDVQRSFCSLPDAPTTSELDTVVPAVKWSNSHVNSPAGTIAAGGNLRRNLLRLKGLSTTAGYLATDCQERLRHFDAAGRYSVEAANAGVLKDVAT